MYLLSFEKSLYSYKFKISPKSFSNLSPKNNLCLNLSFFPHLSSPLFTICISQTKSTQKPVTFSRSAIGYSFVYTDVNSSQDRRTAAAHTVARAEGRASFALRGFVELPETLSYESVWERERELYTGIRTRRARALSLISHRAAPRLYTITPRGVGVRCADGLVSLLQVKNRLTMG